VVAFLFTEINAITPFLAMRAIKKIFPKVEIRELRNSSEVSLENMWGKILHRSASR
jgi:hypothetical protein